MLITTTQKQKIRQELLAAFERYTGSQASFARSLGINSSIFSRIKKGEVEDVLADKVWLNIARKYDVNLNSRNWNVARTRVYTQIEDNLKFCQDNQKAMILVDDCGIGKTFCARHIVKTLTNAFYFDCSQAKTKMQFIRELAKTVGVDHTGRYVDVKGDLKYYVANFLHNPIIILDEAGDLDYAAFMELKELWNATEGACAWYMMGADGLRDKIQRGLNRHKVGYAEIFDRFSDEFIKLVPVGKADRQVFYRDLISTVAKANASNKHMIPSITKQCLTQEKSLRHLQTLIKLSA